MTAGITPEAVAADELKNEWNKITAKIARHGLKALNERELARYEEMRQNRGMLPTAAAKADEQIKLGVTPEAVAAAREGVPMTTAEIAAQRAACLCGCGGFPKSKTARFIPGHDARYHSAEKKRLAGEAVTAGQPPVPTTGTASDATTAQISAPEPEDVSDNQETGRAERPDDYDAPEGVDPDAEEGGPEDGSPEQEGVAG